MLLFPGFSQYCKSPFNYAPMKKYLLLACLALAFTAGAQIPDHVYFPNIHTVKLYRYGDIYSYPVLMLNSGDQLELHFDDMDGGIKNYYCGFQLCNADWTPANVQPVEYIKGFWSSRITTYRTSNITRTRYTHYQAILPDKYSMPTKSGNYLLKVFLNDDTSRLAFTKRLMIVDKRAAVSAQITQPFNGSYYQTHQRIQVAVSTNANQVNTFSPQDLKVVIIQNYNWNTAAAIDRPTIFRGNYFEYSDDENTTFPGGKEWRWFDLRSLRLLSDRMIRKTENDTTGRYDVYVKPDVDRRQQLYVYTNDIDGLYTVENSDGNNPYWQSDYAYTHFTFVPPGNRALEGRSLYIFGELTNYELNDASRMEFNNQTGVYEKELYLKQGYYNYSYVMAPDKKQRSPQPVLENAEGNYWSTENNYMVMVYFRAFGARADELVGFVSLNSTLQR